MDSFKRTLAIMHIELLRSELNQTSKRFRGVKMTHGRPAGKPRKQKGEVEGAGNFGKVDFFTEALSKLENL